MGKKRRQTAKSGEKHLNKLAENASFSSTKKHGGDDDDPMFDEVERYHNSRDEEFLKLDGKYDESDTDSSSSEEEAVMDLAVDAEDSSSASSSDEEEEQQDSEEDEVISSSDEEDDLSEVEDVRDWGGKKSSYYHGDTADLELGQDEEEAFLEEEAVKDVQASRYKDMAEEDFMLSDTEEQDSTDEGKKDKSADIGDDFEESNISKPLKLSSLRGRETAAMDATYRLKLLNKQHAGLLPILSHFSQVVKDMHQNTIVATKALCQGEEDTAELVGATGLGKQYLITKSLLQATAGLNLAAYLLLKSEQNDDNNEDLIQSHPVMTRLQQWNVLIQTLEDKVENRVEGLAEQLDNLVKAVALMESEPASKNTEEMSISSTGESERESGSSSPSIENKQEKVAEVEQSSSSSEAGEHDDSESDEDMEQNIVNNARFGLRQNEIMRDKARNIGSRRRRKRLREGFSEFDDNKDDNATASSRSLASTINAIEQRSKSRNKKKSSSSFVPEDLGADDDKPDDSELRRGIEMMEAELGKLSDEEDRHDGDLQDYEDNDLDNDDIGGSFYSKIKKQSKQRKAFKKNLYQVAPKYPTMEGEVDGERAIGRAIMKNRGLVAHKNKLNRNPRVKKREQYRKAVIRRKGAVRDVRNPDEGHKYGGEQTGIKSGLSRSRKLR